MKAKQPTVKDPPAKVQAPAKLDMDSLLDAAAKTPGRKTSSLAFDGELAGELAQRWLKLEREQDERSRELAELRDKIIAAVRDWHQEECTRKGEYLPTVEIPTDVGTVRVSFPHRYSKIPAAKEPLLRAAVGADFDLLFHRLRSLKVRPAIAADRQQLEELVGILAKAIGPDRFTECFEAEQLLQPTPRLTQTRAQMPDDVREQLEHLGVNQVVSVSAAA